MTITVSRSRVLFYALLVLLVLALLLAFVVVVDNGPAPDARPNRLRFDSSFDPENPTYDVGPRRVMRPAPEIQTAV